MARTIKKVCIIGISGKLGQYMIEICLDKGYQVVGVCRESSVNKLDKFKDKITIFPGATDDEEVVKKAVAGCDGVLTVLCPWGFNHYSLGTASAVIKCAEPDARLIFSCGWHITKDGQDKFTWSFNLMVSTFAVLGRLFNIGDLNDQVEACQHIFNSKTLWTVVRGSALEEGPSQGLPVWAKYVHDPILQSNITRRIDFALFMVCALENATLIHEAPAINGCQTPSALAHQKVENH